MGTEATPLADDAPAPERHPREVLRDIRAKSATIHKLRTARDDENKPWTNMGPAISLQRAERERKTLQASLPPMRLATLNGERIDVV